MNGHATNGAQHELAMENFFLKRENEALEQHNNWLREYCIHQKKKLDSLENRTGWEKFNDSLLTLGEHRIDDAINKLVKQRHLYSERPGTSGRRGGPFQLDARGSPFPFEKQSPRATNNAQGSPRSTTALDHTTAKTHSKREVQPSLKRMDSAFGLATRLASLFKKSRKHKGKDRGKDDIIENEGWEIREQEESEIRAREDHDERLIQEQRTRPTVIKPVQPITGTHERPGEWKLQQAQEEYKNSLENKTAPFPACKISIKTTNGRHRAGKESQEVEEEMVVALEKDLLDSFPRNKGSIRTMNWPEGLKADEDAFDLIPHPGYPETFQLQSAPIQAQPSQSYPTLRLPTRRLSTQALSTGALAPPASPPPTVPLPILPTLPTVPHQARPNQSRLRPRQTRPPPIPPAQAENNVFRFSRPKTPPSQMTPAHRAQRIRKRRSAPSPTPRFVTYRPTSPSPGGNEPMGANPVPSWLKTRRNRKEGEGGGED